ncbi:MAG TPA: CAP domain-containing protein [Candidatus Krumholzibacterium sp.]|nr:CAP domain-containing protein [Candidatus Krumholzibacterium sp.]
MINTSGGVYAQNPVISSGGVYAQNPGISSGSASAQSRSLIDRVPEDEFELYRYHNEKEKRLPGFKDSDEVLAAKLIQLAYINETRAKSGVQPVRLDILASRLANKMAAEAAIKNYAGHWNTAGEKPYHRWAFEGGLDHVSENAAAMSTNGSFDVSPLGAVRMMREMYDEFMSEKPPDDGHRQTCIDRNHNYVGLGYFTSRYQFRYYEEYLDRYLNFYDVDNEVAVEEECRISFKPRSGGSGSGEQASGGQASGEQASGRHASGDQASGELHVYALLAYWEPFPEPMTPREISRMGSYDDYTPDMGIAIWPWEIGSYLNGDRFEIPLIFPEEGLYYIHIYLDDREFSGTEASTIGKLQASGIVIRVK